MSHVYCDLTALRRFAACVLTDEELPRGAKERVGKIAHEAMRCARCQKARPNYWVAVPQ